jgi:crotonobetainyl-CoA:carnitine CoA-transferase CaiB-like acyl-CoA transferase
LEDIGMTLLAGTKVVDFTANAAGPYCTMLLADMGAEVVKIEPPTGDSARGWGEGSPDQRSFLFLAVNRSKRSLVLDLRTEEGLRTAHRLVTDADVVVESFAPGIADKLGVGYDTCRALRPGVIYCSVSGFGQTGPLSREPGFDMMLQAYTGIMSMNGEPGAPPARIPISALDLMTGSLAYSSVIAALWRREKDGVGERIDASLYDSALNLLCYAVPEYTATGRSPGRHGGQFPYLAPYEVFSGRDAFFYLGVGTESAWRKLCGLLDDQDLTSDPRFATNSARVLNRSHLRERLQKVFKMESAEVWVSRFKELRIPAALIRSVGDALTDEHCRARQATAPIPGLGDVHAPSFPVKFDNMKLASWTEPPLLDEAAGYIRDSLAGESGSQDASDNGTTA